MDGASIVCLTPETISDFGVCGYKNAAKHAELRKKIEWYRRYYPLGARILALVHEDGGYQGMIEYIPGTYVHRPVSAGTYMAIHCVFVGFNKEYKGRGYGSRLVAACIDDARENGLDGVVAVARKGSFMAGSDIFRKMGFTSMGKAEPDFELLALKFRTGAPDPSFLPSVSESPSGYGNGLVILRSPQCPYTEKNVSAIVESARSVFDMDATVVDLDGHVGAQKSPCPFGAFCIMLDGEKLSHHPISKARFENIMKKRGAKPH